MSIIYTEGKIEFNDKTDLNSSLQEINLVTAR